MTRYFPVVLVLSLIASFAKAGYIDNGGTGSGSGGITNETDTLATVLARGNNAAGQSATNFSDIYATDSGFFISGSGTNTRGTSTRNHLRVGVVGGVEKFGVFPNVGYGAAMLGRTVAGGVVTNNGVGALQLFDLSAGQIANTTSGGDASILLGAGTVSNRMAIVAGDGQESHGDGSITAGGGFFGSGSNLTDITAAQVGAAPTNNFLGLVNGLSVRDPTMTISVDGTGPYATINPSPAGQIEYWFGNSLVQYGTSAVVRLTAGTTNTPTLNYICARPDGTITNYTSYPYLTSGTAADARAIMFEVFLIDTNSIAAGYGSAVRSWTDNVEDRRGLGRISWIGERVRRLPAIWESGCQVTLLATNASVATNYVLTASGTGWQMHSHTIPENTNMTAMTIINEANGFRTITNLQDITHDSSGAPILEVNGDCMGVNVMLFVESGITPRKASIMLVLPSDDYNGAFPAATKLANCIADSSGYDGTGVPIWMQGMSIRLARLVIRRDSATARTYWVYDRRGQPLGTAGGGASSSGESDPLYEADLASGLIVTNYAATPFDAPIVITNESALTVTSYFGHAYSRTFTSTGTITHLFLGTNATAGNEIFMETTATGLPARVWPSGFVFGYGGTISSNAPSPTPWSQMSVQKTPMGAIVWCATGEVWQAGTP